MSELQILSPDLLRTVSSYSSISDYFIDKIVSNHDNGFDFTMEQVFQLCDIEPQHCQDVFRTLQRSVENKNYNVIPNKVKKPVKFPDELPAYKEHLRISLVEEEEVTNEGIFTRLKIDSKQYNDTLSKLTMPSSLDLFTIPVVPKYLFLVGLLPMFPLILLFAGSSALSFVLTTSIEFILSIILPQPREVTFGKIWIGLTLVMFVPMLVVTMQIVVDLVASFL